MRNAKVGDPGVETRGGRLTITFHPSDSSALLELFLERIRRQTRRDDISLDVLREISVLSRMCYSLKESSRIENLSRDEARYLGEIRFTPATSFMEPLLTVHCDLRSFHDVSPSAADAMAKDMWSAMAG
jgi:hypothetical protein